MPSISDKGLKFAFKRSTSPVAYCSLSILAGTRFEESRYCGLAHFIEHTIFKGTEQRSAKVINSYIEKLGGELNAYTTKEEIVIHSTVLKEDLSKAIELLIELAFCPTFPEKELEKEKMVVLDEINSYKDSPADQIFDDFEEYLFEGTQLALPVLGKSKTLKSIKSETVHNYISKRFTLNNMSFSVVANVDETAVEKMLIRALDKYHPKNCSTEVKIMEQVTHPNLKVASSFTKSISKKNHQVHCIIGMPAYSYFDKRRIALILLVNILGGPAANSRLNLLLREKNALVYTVDASYTQYTDTGIVTIYFGCDKDYLEKCIKLVEKELAHFRETTMSPIALKGAKKQLLGQLAISSDNGEAQCLSMGKSLLVFGRVIEQEEIKELIEAISAEEIREVACDLFSPSKISKLIYL